MRGKAPLYHPQQAQEWITPAYAGKSRRTTPVTSWQRDHPRVCGEKLLLSSKSAILWGSPPRMRGKVIDDYLVSILDRITPAYAGKSTWRRRWKYQVRDHPRVCGEKVFVCVCVHDIAGSPPRMRGKVFGLFCPKVRVGITPAYAGKRRAVSCLP